MLFHVARVAKSNVKKCFKSILVKKGGAKKSGKTNLMSGPVGLKFSKTGINLMISLRYLSI